MEVPHIDVDELASLPEPVLIDVRMPDEYVAAHVPGADLVPLPELAARSAEIPTDGTIYVICASGGRSLRACEHLRGLGVDAVNVAGGTKAWIEAGRPTAIGDTPR